MASDSSYLALLQPLLSREAKLSKELDSVRAAIASLRSAADANAPDLSELSASQVFENLSFPEMTSKAIEVAGRALVSREILNVLNRHGVTQDDSDASVNKVQSALRLRADEVGDIAHIGDGKWACRKWYTEKELEELTSKIDGANARDRKEHSKRTKEAMAALKAAGHKLGKKHFVRDYPLRMARWVELWPLIESGEITGAQIIKEMNAADPKAPKVKTPQSFYNWKRKGFEGFDVDTASNEATKIRLVK